MGMGIVHVRDFATSCLGTELQDIAQQLAKTLKEFDSYLMSTDRDELLGMS